LTLPEENRQAMGRAARTETEQRFSSIKMVDRYEALYDELLGKGQDPPCM
jgi:glycosyltransferase involved in cell wall biosynthesis